MLKGILSLFLVFQSNATTKVFAEILTQVSTNDQRTTQNQNSSPIIIGMHTLARDFLPYELKNNAIQYSLSYSGPRLNYSNVNTTFIRDYAPIKIGSQLLAYPSFLNELAIFWGGHEDDMYLTKTYDPVLDTYSVPYRISNQIIRIPTKKTNLILEGGNVHYITGTSNSKPALILSEKVVHDNSLSNHKYQQFLNDNNLSPQDQHKWMRNLFESSYVPRSESQIKEELNKLTQVPLDRIYIRPWMPGEKTGHVDIYSVIIDPETIAIMDYSEELIEELKSQESKEFARKSKKWLDEQAQFFSSQNFKVKRIPSLPPQNLSISNISPFGFDAIYPSTANLLILDGKAFVPDFPTLYDQFSSDKLNRFNSELEHFFSMANLPFQKVKIDRDLFNSRGLIHCITSEIPIP